MKKLFTSILVGAGCAASATAGVDFNRDIRPILSNKCFACHGFDEHDRKADLRLDTKEGAFEDLGGYAAIVPGDLEASEAWYRIITDDEDEIMPPPKFHKPITAEERELLKQWIEEGAEYKTHWSYAPLQDKNVPQGESTVDHFIKKELSTKGMALSPQTDQVTLARRLHFDLLGLPPKSEIIDGYLADKSPEAYSKLVDQLLAHPAFGERMAVYWLDLVRYADTIGYHSDNFMEVSAYRDYVIDAFNKNLPYDQFTIEQLAGDLLPDATQEQKIASGYNRLLQTTEEGGAQAAEYLTIYAADRVRNVSNVWIGSTIGCAQCHDHKYDPFTARDFYTFAAFFADVKEKTLGRRQPNLKLPTESQSQKMVELREQIKQSEIPAVLAADADLSANLAKAQLQWQQTTKTELESDAASMWQIVKPVEMVSKGKQVFKVQEDGSVLATGPNPAKDDYTFTLTAKGQVSAILLEARRDKSFRKNFSRGNGNFVLSEFRVKHGDQQVKIAKGLASHTQGGFPIEKAFDGKVDGSGWAGDGHGAAVDTDRQALFIFENPIDLGDGGELVVEMIHQSPHSQHNIGRPRLSLTSSLNPGLSGVGELPTDVVEALKLSAADRSDEQTKKLTDYYTGIAPLLADKRKHLESVKKQLADAEKNQRTMLVSEPLPTPRMTRILNRGDWMDKDGEVVEPALPAFLPRDGDLPADRRGNRLDLAHWIVGDSNPLTARTMVNRMWMLLFGEGISRNVDDLGGQGEPPTHPELLDQLAIDFKNSGWDLKGLVKAIVMSETYRQSSTPSESLVQDDPTNLLWARQGRWRLDAEFVRDTALQLSGLLVEKQGGVSVKPYQPAGYWQHLNFPKRKWEQGANDDLYRRGLYTFRCRSFTHPSMLSFDAPSREECTSQRTRSNIPQQALVLLNDPSYVEASRKFADEVAKREGNTAAKVSYAWKSATSREPSAEEQEILEGLYQAQLKIYQADQEQAKAYLATGHAPRDESIDLAEAAAWTQVTRAILNAYETTSRN